jgi:hypothetical protein
VKAIGSHRLRVALTQGCQRAQRALASPDQFLQTLGNFHRNFKNKFLKVSGFFREIHSILKII